MAAGDVTPVNVDREIEFGAMRRIDNILDGLDWEVRTRVLVWVADRFNLPLKQVDE